MGKIVWNFIVTLDGVVESPDKWHFPYFDDAMSAIMAEGMATSAACMMGRRLYDEWSSYWPGRLRRSSDANDRQRPPRSRRVYPIAPTVC